MRRLDIPFVYLGKNKIFVYIINMRKYIKKVAKRVAKKAGRAMKRRYVTKTGKGLRMGQIVKDVAYLKSVLNPEKKLYSITNTDGAVGQCVGNNNGYWVQDITPLPSQGTTSSTRNGNSIKLHSSYLKFQLQAQSSSNGTPIKFRVMVIKVIGEPQVISSAPGEMFKNNSFVTGGSIIDYNSDRREDTFKRFVILRSRNVYLRPNYHTSQLSIATFGMGLKYKSHHIKFTTDGNQTIADGQIFLLILADNGNASLSTTSTLAGTASTAVATGANLQFDINHYFYDN